MTALAAARQTPSRSTDIRSFGVSATAQCFQGGIAVLAAGFVEPGTAATGLVAVGKFRKTVTGGAADGDVTAEVDTGCFRFANSAAADEITAADIGADCFIVDDQTVAKTDGGSARSVAGKVFDVDELGVWVEFR